MNGSFSTSVTPALKVKAPITLKVPIQHAEPSEPPSLTKVLTLVLWLICLAIGLTGLLLPHARPVPPDPRRQPVKVEKLNVELVRDVPPAKKPTPRRLDVSVEKIEQPNIPSPIPVVQPATVIAYTVPLNPIAPVAAIQHDVATNSVPDTKPVPVPDAQPLVFGRGEGRQPAPEYPARARREGQEGNVTVRLTVAKDGHVIAASILRPSPWHLLDDSALRAVREKWHFQSGKPRIYDVVIRFELTH